MNNYDVIIKPVLSEKSYSGIGDKKYTFMVVKNATKTQIKAAVEKIFEVTVSKVNVVNYSGKIKKMGKTSGRRASYKKAYVTLTQDSKAIEFFESLS